MINSSKFQNIFPSQTLQERIRDLELGQFWAENIDFLTAGGYFSVKYKKKFVFQRQVMDCFYCICF